MRTYGGNGVRDHLILKPWNYMEAIGQFRAANILSQAKIVRYPARRRQVGLQN
jgi:hypothetical protein